MSKAVIVCNTKGGTGKTLTAINIAYRLSEKGHKVALIDADFDSSNFAEFTKTDAKIELENGDVIKPYTWKNGIKVFSMSLLEDRHKSVSMTADRYVQMLADALYKADWGKIDYWVIDMPAGSSDIFKAVISLFKDKFVGSIVVTHPANPDDTERILRLHEYYEIPVLGVIENMSYFKCPKCGTKTEIYGQSHLEEACKRHNVPALGKIPVSEKISNGIRTGDPILKYDLAKPIKAAVEHIENAEVATPSFLRKVSEKIKGSLITAVQKIVANFIVTVNKTLDIGALKSKYGFTEERVFDLVIVDPSWEKVIVRAHLKTTPQGIKVLKNAQPEFELVTDFRTLARVIMGKRRLATGEIVDFEPVDAWLNGDVKVYGEGHLPKAIRAIRTLFTDKEVLATVREKYGKTLMKFI